MLVGVLANKFRCLRLSRQIEQITVEEIGKYVKDMKELNYEQYLKSETPVDNAGKSVATLVGTNYLDTVKDP